MSKRKGSRRSYSKRRGGRGKKHGIIMGLGLIDLAQVAYTTSQMGVPEAAGAAMNGDFQGAGDVLVAHVVDPSAWIGTVVGNIIIGFGGKLIRRYSPASVRKYL